MGPRPNPILPSKTPWGCCFFFTSLRLYSAENRLKVNSCIYKWDEVGEQPLDLRIIAWHSGKVPKYLPDGAGDSRDSGLIPGSGRSPGGGNGNSVQYTCLENLMDRGAWRATVHGFAKSRTPRKHIEHRALQKNKSKKQEKTHKSQMKTVLWPLRAFFGDHQCTQGLYLDLNTLLIKMNRQLIPKNQGKHPTW